MSRPPRSAGARQRTRRLAVVMALVVTAAGVGWGVGSRLRSPAEAAASRQPPAPSPITVPVEKRTLSDDLIRRGSVRFNEATPLSLAGPVGGEGTATQVVTRAPSPGDAVVEGGVVLEVNGRPVIVLQGAQPTYRALTPGAQGRDVEQLEAALARLGFDPGPQDGLYDAATQAAVGRLYQVRGYTAQGPTAQEQTALAEARKASTAAEDRVREATKALADAGKVASGSELLALENELKEATRAVDAARGDASRADSEAAAAVTARSNDLDAARLAATQAADALALATRTGQDPAGAGTPCDAACTNRLQADVTAKNAAVTAAVNALDTARAAVPTTAQRGRDGIARADDNKALAQTRLNEAKAPRDTSTAAAALDAARTAATQAAADLARIQAHTGTVVPAGEVLFLPELPRRIDGVKAKVGDPVSAGFATVSGADLAIDSSVDVADAGRVKPGMRVSMRLSEIDRRLEGTVEAVADKPGTGGAPAGQVQIRIRPDDTADAAQLNGLGVVVTIPLRSTGGAEVLTVPVSALSTRADGTTWLRVIAPDGTGRDQQVTTGIQAQGVAEVAAVPSGRLEAGDRVVVGEEAASDG